MQPMAAFLVRPALVTAVESIQIERSVHFADSIAAETD